MNYLDVGETALSLARRVAPKLTESAIAEISRAGTSLLERSGFLSRIDSNHKLKAMLTDMAKDAMPAVQKAAGAGSHAGGDLLIVGKPMGAAIDAQVVPHANSLMIYEPHQNIAIHPDGQFRIDSPTPSGQRIRSDHYQPNGNWLGNTYSTFTADGFGRIQVAPQEAVNATVVSQFGSRQLMFDTAWNSSRPNFSINPVVDKFIRDTKPLVAAPDISHLMGRTVSTPIADGKLIGFDRATGEALVTQEGAQATAQFSKKVHADRYPVKLAFGDDLQVAAQRDAQGKIFPFSVESKTPVFQSANTTVFAFSPLEVKLGGQPLSEIMGLDNSTGLRAMGGYSTVDGARIPIPIPIKETPHAPRHFAKAFPKAHMDILPRGASKPAAEVETKVSPAADLKLPPRQVISPLETHMQAEQLLRMQAETRRLAEEHAARLRTEATLAAEAREQIAPRSAPRSAPQSSPLSSFHSSPFGRSF